MESKVRTQKAISLSSGESEFVAMVAGCSEGMLIRHLWNQITGQSCKTKVRSDSSAARGMTQRQGIGRVRHLDASLLWIQQKEKEKVITVAAIPSELNSADIGTKNLAKKRLNGLLYMIHMVDAVGDRVGEQEYHELEHNYQLKQGMKTLGKGRDLRIGLLLLLANMERSTAMSTEEKSESHFDFGWALMCVCALMGALSLCKWLRDYLIEGVGGIGIFMLKKMTAMIKEEEVNMTKEKSSEDKQTQSTYRVDYGTTGEYEAELQKYQEECFLKDTYIEELEPRVKYLEEHVQDFCMQATISDREAIKWQKRLASLKMTPKGRVFHFSPMCRFWERGTEVRMCEVYMGEGGVSEFTESKVAVTHAYMSTRPTHN